MLNLQAQTLEQQERLYKNQIRLNIREILQEELNFYQQALANISSTAAVLGGFSLTTMQIIPAVVDTRFEVVESFYYFFAISAAGTCLLTVVFSQFSALFSMRLALRGGETSVEDTISRVRGEYQLVLLMLVSGVELFLCCIPFLCVCKLKSHNAAIVCTMVIPMCFIVIYFYKRAKSKFYLKSNETFMSSKGDVIKGRKGKSHQNINYLKDIDSRNEDRRVPHYSTRRTKGKDKKKNPLQMGSQHQYSRSGGGGGGGGGERNEFGFSKSNSMPSSNDRVRSRSQEVRRGGSSSNRDHVSIQIGPQTREDSESAPNGQSRRSSEQKGFFSSFTSKFASFTDDAAVQKKIESNL